MSMAHRRDLHRHCVEQLGCCHQSHDRRCPFEPNTAARLAGDLGVRQQAIGSVEDRARHAVADRQHRHLGGGGTDVRERLGPVLLTCGRRGLGEVTENRHRSLRAAPADHPQRDGGMVLGFVDDDVTERERSAVEHRVGLVDQELIGDRPTPALPRRPGQQLVDQADRLLHRPCLGHRGAQFRRTLPLVVAIRAPHQLSLHQTLQSLATAIDRSDTIQRLVDPSGELIGSDDQRPRPDRQSQIFGRSHDVADTRLGQAIEHLRRALPAPRCIVVRRR